MSELDLGGLRAFVTVCETGSITQTARVLRITQSAVSQRLAKLEGQLNCQLIDRDCRPARATVAGQTLLARARSILGDVDRISSDLRQRTNQPLPELKLGISDSLGSILVPAIIGLLQDSASQITIRVGSSNDICGKLLQRELHIVITSELLLDRNDLDRYEIYREPLILVVPRDRCPEAEMGIDMLQRLEKTLPLIRYSTVSPLARQIEAYLRRLRLNPPHRLEFNESETILSVIREGLGWTITTPLCVLQSHVDLESVEIRRLPVSHGERTISLVARNGELSLFPRELAAISQDIIRQKVIQRITKDIPWLSVLMHADGLAVAEGKPRLLAERGEILPDFT